MPIKGILIQSHLWWTNLWSKVTVQKSIFFIIMRNSIQNLIRKLSANPYSCGKRIFLLAILILIGFSLFAQEFSSEEESKPLLRVFPIFRPEECEGAIRFDICLRCMKKRERYAQRILFMKEGGPYREHGCYTDEKGFYVLR